MIHKSVILLLISCLLNLVHGNGSNLPMFSPYELRSGQRLEELARVLTSTGILTVSSPEIDALRSVALHGLCLCQESLALLPQSDQVTLDDKVTLRTSLATATVGSTPMALSPQIGEMCGSFTAEAMDQLRDAVAEAASAFSVALDRVLGTSELLRDNYGKTYHSTQAILEASNHLEHFHVYDKKENTHVSTALDWHTDAGLFLGFVPAWDCISTDRDASFWFRDQQGQASLAEFAPDSVVIMLGLGAQNWLQTNVPLKAAVHAVHMRAGQLRAWYGMMHLVPESAIIQTIPQVRTFGDMKRHMSISIQNKLHHHQETSHVSIGCGSGSTLDSQTAPARRRRLQTHADPSECNNSTNFFCWMSCLDIPSYQEAESYENEGYSLYCLDPAVLAQTDSVSKAMEPCPYGVHNSNCIGKWHKTAPGVPATKVIYNSTEANSIQYCYGGTSMYMDGFHWARATSCVIFLVPQWVLSTPGKLAAACIGTIFFGILLELVILRRRKVVTSLKPGYLRLATSTIFYGVQLTMGYLIMLVVMTYSGVLFLSVILGLMGGHVLFNAKDAVLSGKASVKTEEDLPLVECPKDCPAVISESTEKSCCSSLRAETGMVSITATNYGTSTGDKSGVPEGLTPCCMNTL